MTALDRRHPEFPPTDIAETFCRSLISADAPGLDSVLSPDFESHHPELRARRARFIDAICRSGTVTGMLLGDADWTLEGESAFFGPIVVHLVNALEPLGARLELGLSQGDWLVEGLDITSVPRSYLYRLADNSSSQTCRFRLKETDGTPVAGRISILDDQGEYWPPAGHAKMFRTGWNQDVGGDVLVRGRRFAYVDGEFLAMLPPGNYSILAERGPEYRPSSVDFVVDANEPPEPMEIELNRWVHMKERSWFSGDTHVHMMSPHASMLEARGEDLDVVNLLAAQWADYFTNVEDFVGSGPALTAPPSHVVSVAEESRHTHYGHTCLLNLNQLVWPMAWGQRRHSNEGVWGGHDWPSMSAVADDAHGQDSLVVWAHIVEGAMDAELAVAAVLGKLDAVEVFHLTDPIFETTWGDDPQRPTTFPWYRLLNCGFRLPAVAGTDKMYNQQVIGAVRAYVHVDGEFSFERWLSSIADGKTFVTSGPIIDMTVNDFPIGAELDLRTGAAVSISARAESQYPLDMLQIVCNGETVAETLNPDNRLELRLHHDLDLNESSWVAARCYGGAGPRVQEVVSLGAPGMPLAAHTSPTWLHVDGDPVRIIKDLTECRDRVVHLIEWLESEAHFRTEREHDETLAPASAALIEFDRMLERDQ